MVSVFSSVNCFLLSSNETGRRRSDPWVCVLAVCSVIPLIGSMKCDSSDWQYVVRFQCVLAVIMIMVSPILTCSFTSSDPVPDAPFPGKHSATIEFHYLYRVSLVRAQFLSATPGFYNFACPLQLCWASTTST